MNIILGATGQVGSLLIEKLLEYKQPVKIVVRNEEKAKGLKEKGAEVVVADYFDVNALKSAFQDGDTVFLLTPENPASEDVIQDTSRILKNYHDAIKGSNIKRIIGLSSFGAQHGTNTGNLEMSYMLEHAFNDLDVELIFVRPAYYYSNWMGYYDIVKETGMLPTFFPPELKIPMIAPTDVADFIADIFVKEVRSQNIFEISGPELYSANDIAKVFGQAINRNVTTMEIPKEEWLNTLKQVGFSELGAKNITLMTDAVISGKTQAEYEVINLKTTFLEYISSDLSGK